MSRLKNKVAVVTGGTSGIGLGTVKRRVAEGAVAYVFGRRKEELEKMAASLGPNVATVSGDVRNLDDLDRLYATIAYTAIAITNGPAGKHWPIAALYPAYTSR